MRAPSLSLGRYEAFVVSAGTFALDGGAMFGVIPKALWQKKMPADEQNRVRLGLNVLVLRDGERTVLVDTGMGDKWSSRHREIFGLEGPGLIAGLSAVGIAPKDVTDVFLTHLHFDHAGGATVRREDGTLAPAFSNARIHVGRKNLEWAKAATERDRGSYREENFRPLLEERDRLVLLDEGPRARCEPLPDVEVVVCEGHTTGQLLPFVGAKDQRLLFAADMIPTRAHVRTAWHMGYDLRPLDVLREKRALLERCVNERIPVLFEHEPDAPLSPIEPDGDDFQAGAPILSGAAPLGGALG